MSMAVEAPNAGAILARLDRLPATRHIWAMVALLSLGGMFEFYDLFFTGYVVPGLVRAGLLANVSLAIFTGPALFVAATFGGLFIGTFVFGYVADRYGRRTIFTWSMLWYSATTVIMAVQTTGMGVCLWRLIAGIGIGVELVTIDTYFSELMPKDMRGRAFAINQAIQFMRRAGGGLACVSAGAAGAVRHRRLALGRVDRLGRARSSFGSCGAACRKARAG